jgi:hypothetical protein
MNASSTTVREELSRRQMDALRGRHSCGHFHATGTACPPVGTGWCGNPRCCH